MGYNDDVGPGCVVGAGCVGMIMYIAMILIIVAGACWIISLFFT